MMRNTFNFKKILFPCLTILPVLPLTSVSLAGAEAIHDHHAMGHAHHQHGGVQFTGGMAPHQHKAGEWMFGLSYETRDFSGIHFGSQKTTTSALADAGFSMYASSMRMEMAMLHFMYGVTDNITLVIMPHYMRMDMDMLPVSSMGHMGASMPTAMTEGQASMGAMGDSMTDSGSMHNHSTATNGAAMHGTDMHDMGMNSADTMNIARHASAMSGDMSGHGGHGGMAHSMSVSGWSDTVFGAQFKVCDESEYQVYANVNFSAPTGSVTRKQASGAFMPYGMQLGSGTWDFLPGIVITHAIEEQVLVGGRLSARLPLEDRNESGYFLGDTYNAEAWIGASVTEYLAGSVRLMYEKRNRISGHYNGAHNHASPTDFQENYGGEFVDIGLGLHLNPGVAGLQFGAEWVVPVAEHYNGFQIGRDQGVQFNVSLAL